MVKPRRKSARSERAYRRAYRDRRDNRNLEFLRTVRDIAREEMVAEGGKPEALSVYNSIYFPLVFQIVERESDINNKYVKGIKGVSFDCSSRNMPNWNDLTKAMRMEIFQLLCEEWENSLYAFNPKIHPELLKEAKITDVVGFIRRRVARELGKLGDLPKRYVLVVEGHSKKGSPVDLHVHGMAMVEGPKQAEKVKQAVGRAVGQEVKGRGKLAGGNSGKFCYYEVGKSWAKYITKNSDKPLPGIERRHEIFSQAAVKITREFYNYVTGQ